MEDAFICSGTSEWQKYRITEINNNTIKNPDMAWDIDGEILYDSRSAYSLSSVFNCLFQNEKTLTKGISYDDENIPIFTIDAKMTNFQTIRIFCHTGLVRFNRGESIVKTIDRYSSFHMYDIEGGKLALRTLISQKLTPINAIQAFEYAIGREDSELLYIINDYIATYAFVVFRHRNFTNITRESLTDLILLMKKDSLNIKEMDLLESIYTLCQKKISEKEFSDFDTPVSLMMHKFEKISMWDCINIKSITLEEFMIFIERNENFMSDTQIVNTLRYIHNPQNPTKKRKFQVISSYPRNLNINGSSDGPQGDITHWDRDKIQIFYVFDYNKKDITHLPSTILNDNWTIRSSIHYLDKGIYLKGNIFHSSNEPGKLNITTKFVNFRHERWKKNTLDTQIKSQCEFEIPNMLSYNSIDNGGGYLFDVNRYPEYIEGSWLMMSLCIEIKNEKNIISEAK